MQMPLKVELVRVNNGIYNVFVIKDDEYIGPCIARGYEWDGWMRLDIQKCYKEGTDIIDIGANIGYNSLMFSDYGPVHSFEPVYHEIVNLNINSNNLKNNVYVYPCALSNVAAHTTIYVPHKGCQNASKINYGGTSLIKHKENIPIDIRCAKLDDVYKGNPSVIKIDVEGHELQVLKGATEIIKKYRPSLLIEIVDYDTSEIPEYLKSLGYGEPEKRPEWIYLYRAKDILSTM
jgi:FkbM family methyltransferase